VTARPISTCSQDSEASRSPRKPPASKRSPCAKKSRAASGSSEKHGGSRSTQTSPTSTGDDTGAFPFLLADHPANQRAEPGNNSARMMTAGSGMKVSAFLPNHGRMALFSRTLLGSSIWRSTEYLLRWQVLGVPRVISETYLLVQDERSSTRSWQRHPAPSRLPHPQSNAALNPMTATSKRVKEWRQKNPAKRAKLRRDYARRHPEKMCANVTRWKKKNPAKCAAIQARRRARTALADDVQAVARIYHMAATRKVVRCYLCRHLIPKGEREVEHVVPLSKGGRHCSSNLGIACRDCNRGKHDKMPAEVGLLL
jgi:5-methylcytosine-specific restriction endonuclease McrA